MNNCKDEDDYIEYCRNIAKKSINKFSYIGFSAGLIPWPFADLAILYPLFYVMIKLIANCYNIYSEEIPTYDVLKLILGLTPVTTKTAGNISGVVAGQFAGKSVYENLSEQILSINVRLVDGPGNMDQVFSECAVKSTNILYDFCNKLYQLIPSFQFGAKKGMEACTDSFACSYGMKLLTNPESIKTTEEVVKNIGKERAEELLSNGFNFFSKGFSSKLAHILPVISGIFDYYNTLSIGNSAIKYFEAYIHRTSGGELFLKRIEDYQEIFDLIDAKSNICDFASRNNIIN